MYCHFVGLKSLAGVVNTSKRVKSENRETGEDGFSTRITALPESDADRISEACHGGVKNNVSNSGGRESDVRTNFSNCHWNDDRETQRKVIVDEVSLNGERGNATAYLYM